MLLAVPAGASATSIFARQYGLSCTSCHTIVPQLNTFGQNFKSNGYRIAGTSATRALPLSASMLSIYEKSGDDNRTKVQLDELRLQSGGALGPAVTYYIEQYVIDGGTTGSLDQAWAQYDSNTAHPTAKTDIRVRVGMQYLPLPVYADTYRPTLNPYGIFEQTVGQNSSALGDQYTGIDVAAGSDYDTFGIHGFVSPSHVGLFAHHIVGNVDVSAYRVQGLSRVNRDDDVFWRDGIAATVTGKTFEWVTALQTGRDSNPEGTGAAQSSSGGFTQLQWFAGSKFSAVVRWDQTLTAGNSAGSLTSALVFGLSQNSRLTLEDVTQHGSSSLYSALLLGF